MEIARTVTVQAPAAAVWELVSDLPRMGELSPENTGGHWRGGATGPEVGARFRGRNAQGRRRWSTDAEVVSCDPGRSFAFEVRAVGLPVARWAYDVQEQDSGSCTVTETWTDRRGRLIGLVGLMTSGVGDRTEFTARSIEQTLTAVKARLEP